MPTYPQQLRDIKELGSLYEPLRGKSGLTPEHAALFDGACKLLLDYHAACEKLGVPLENDVSLQVTELNSVCRRLSDYGAGPEVRKQCGKELGPIFAASLRHAMPLVQYSKGLELDHGIEQALKRLDDFQGAVNTAQNVQAAEALAQSYEKEAKLHERDAQFWLRITGALFALTILVTAGIVYKSFALLQGLTMPQTIQIALAKLLIFSVALSAAIWSARNYRASRHNSIVNRHRVNNLRTYIEFANVVKDNTTLNAVLLQMSQAIFGSQPSGFLAEGEKSTMMPLEFIADVLRSGGRGTSSSY
jgi:hypothetical protein